MKIALINPPATYGNWYKRPMLGLAYIAACLEKAGLECRVFDAYFNSWSQDQLLQRVIDYTPEVAGITAMTHQIFSAGHIASELKKQLDVRVIVGGCHATALPERTLTEFRDFDYVVCGEAERSTRELVKYIKAGRPSVTHNIPGVVFRNGQEIIHNRPGAQLTTTELDHLPFPAFHHYYGEDKRALAGKHAYYVMVTSRGCPYNCAFCMRVLGKKIRRRSAENVVQEMEYAKEQYGAHTFDFADEVFLCDTSETRDLLQLMIKRGLPKSLRWSGLVRANSVNTDIIALAKEAGCYRLEMGVESGDNQILKAIGKGITVEQVRAAVRIVKTAGISLGTYYILGHPNETRQTLKKTVSLAVELNTDTIAVGLMVPYPGTKIFDMAARGRGGYRLLATSWSDYDKYCSHALEVNEITHREMLKWQRKALMSLYVKNFRFIAAGKYVWQRKHAILFALRKRIATLGGVRIWPKNRRRDT